MTDATLDTPEILPDDAALIARLERRLERERKTRRQAEEIADRGMRDLWLANQELDKRVQDRTAELQRSLADYERASTVRDLFLGRLSHEMRTPMNGILGMLELLDAHVNTEQGERYLAAATESAVGMHELLSRLLDIVDLRSGRIDLDPEALDIAAMNDGIRDTWQRRAMRTGHLLTVSTDGEADVHADRLRTRQIIDELVENALAYATPGLVKVDLVTDHSSGLQVSVSDSGPGMTSEQIASALSGTAETSHGLGLGLARCQQLAELMGGSLTLCSEGESTTAQLQLPCHFNASVNESPNGT